ncbi:hypothetical protein CTAM01_08089 [Colletotrichum tamarilloi]|uniref:FAD-binding domain-containing protein n=1 Tax=Colletotrichum tamarilloi TaxID=1209934 RepID=A0ABQ9R7Q2_9PEZI|nr:uncharacterized protein CTAM01_08089 [Colletotrichum tamarilloi]KAK1497077.1 hypothetical protein CTAM01_08089 [Colletotrichum tamarilloi]
MASSKFLPHEGKHRKIRVAIIGAGISGLAVANGLLKDPAGRFDVQVFERDTIAFNSERGGYQLRISANGLNALKTVSDLELWSLIREVWAGDQAKAPTIVDPDTFAVRLRLGDLKLYPKSRAIPRKRLRGALLQPLLVQGRVHFDHTFARFELMPGERCGVQLHFDGQASQEADILIASDGSNSQVNRQVGLNNKIKLDSMTLIQSRGIISRSVRDELPESLVESGSVMFLGGKDVAGFASVYDPQKDPSTSGTESYTLFWSVDYFRNDLGYGKPLELIMRSATEAVRTGLVTSSVKPKTDWRNGIDKNSRVVLLGDAVHPMTPGRGMGANQALTDAANLVELFHQETFEQDVPSDGELAALARTFDAEMYTRAFKMVEASETVTSLDLTTLSACFLLHFTALTGKSLSMDATIEWFVNGLVIFLDTWLERPDVLPKVLAIDDVDEADYVFISHPHFDHLPGADRIAIKTGAHVIANGEAINVLRSAGVPEDQLIPVSGGERIPLFPFKCRQAAARGEVDIAPGPPGAPPAPDARLAAASVHVWPSLHCLMPGGSHADVPAIMDTGKEYVGGASQYACTLDITFGMKYGLLKIGDHMPRDAMDSGMRSFVDYVNGPARECMSHFDGGQLMYNFLFGEGKTLLWNGHLGGYDGILKTVQPQPDVLIQAIAGRANLNGRPFDGSAAQFAVQVSKLLGEPKKVIWCLHDEAPIKPWTVDVSPATQAVEKETGSKVTALQLGTSDMLF